MASVLRSIGAVVAAFVAACAIMMAVEGLNGRVFYPELGRAAQGVTDPEVIRVHDVGVAGLHRLLSHHSEMLDATAIVVVAGMEGALASVVAGYLAARIAGRAPMGHGLTVGVILTLCGVANNLMLPPPLWFWIASVVVFLPTAWLGAGLVRRG